MTRLQLRVAVQRAYDDVVLSIMALNPVASARREALQQRRIELGRRLNLLRRVMA